MILRGNYFINNNYSLIEKGGLEKISNYGSGLKDMDGRKNHIF